MVFVFDDMQGGKRELLRQAPGHAERRRDVEPAADEHRRNTGDAVGAPADAIRWQEPVLAEEVGHQAGEAEAEARRLGFGYLLRYEHILGDNEEIQEVRCIFIELPGAVPVTTEPVRTTLHTRCASCGESAIHDKGWEAEVWADIHEFEHSRHRVRLFKHARGRGLQEVSGWRG